VVLVGPSGAGKSTWAAARYRADEIVSSDGLRGVVGSGPNDLDASADAFDLLERIIAARIGRGLTTVVDTLGLDEARRTAWLAAARTAKLPAVVIVFDTAPELCRERNRARDRPVPAQVITGQLRKAGAIGTTLDLEGWDAVHHLTETGREAESAPQRPLTLTTPSGAERRSSQGLTRPVGPVTRWIRSSSCPTSLLRPMARSRPVARCDR
jgi:predicted kinase